MATGLGLGLLLGGLGLLKITVFQAAGAGYGEFWLQVGFTVSISLIAVVLWGTTVGSMLPFILRRLGFDPASASAPFVATLVDVTGLIIYFSVASVLLRGALL
jgi:magnesium transporter